MDARHSFGVRQGAAVDGGTRVAVFGGAIILVLMAGWFSMSYLIMHNTAADAFGECLGVGLGLVVVGSVIGAVRSSRDRPDGES